MRKCFAQNNWTCTCVAKTDVIAREKSSLYSLRKRIKQENVTESLMYNYPCIAHVSFLAKNFACGIRSGEWKYFIVAMTQLDRQTSVYFCYKGSCQGKLYHHMYYSVTTSRRRLFLSLYFLKFSEACYEPTFRNLEFMHKQTLGIILTSGGKEVIWAMNSNC